MSKFMYFDFQCTSCETVFEAFVKPDAKPFCPNCGSNTKRLISAPRIDLPGTDPDFPTAYSQWEKTNRAKTAEDKKFHDNHGTDKKHHSYGS